MWVKDAISEGEIDALFEAGRRAWGTDTRLSRHGSQRLSFGQCYVTSRWLVHRLGGSVGVRQGHFVWLSPGGHFRIDISQCDRSSQSGRYIENDGYEPYNRVDNERTKRFIKRADRIFDNLGTLLKLADLGYGGDAFPAEEPQAQSDSDQFDSYWHDEPEAEPMQGEYKFVYANQQLEVSPDHDHDQLASHAGIDPAEHTGPIAVGHIVVANNRATFEAQSNVDLRALARVFKDYCKQVGWDWGGLTDAEGQPISDEFAPKKTKVLSYVYADDHLWLGHTSPAALALERTGADDGGDTRAGVIRVTGRRAEVYPVHVDSLGSLHDWATDNGLRLFAGNDNVLKTIPDLEVDNNYSPNPVQDINPFFSPRGDEREPSGMYKCPACEELFPTWDLYQRHRRDEEKSGDEPNQDGGFPELNMDATFPPHFTEDQPQVFPLASYRDLKRCASGGEPGYIYYAAFKNGSMVGCAELDLRNGGTEVVSIHGEIPEAEYAIKQKLGKHFEELWSLYPCEGLTQVGPELYKWSKDQPATDMLESPVPFIYDVDEDNVTVGQPGVRTSDIPGKFTPGGIVEGTYEPGGKVVLRSLTSIPYTVRHLIHLWYYQHPELEVKSVHLRDDAGKDTRLASTDVGHYISTMVAADPAAHKAAQTLMGAGGHVYAVGGAVRDAVMGNAPKDIDLMVAGLPSDQVESALDQLPGRVDFTGKDFGVFRYRTAGNDVEIALPRRERSTGAGHQDFDVEADHTMKPEDDLYRRDFTANAMAVDLSSGKLVDPFDGAGDIASRTLRTLNEGSLREDPLRTVRGLVAHARHGLNPDEATRAQMKSAAQGLQHLPPERIQSELDKLMAAQDPAGALRLAHETGVLQHILPEVEQAFGYDQNNPHHEKELGDHLLSVLERTAQMTDDPDVRLASVLHDIGKPASAWKDPETGSNHYYFNSSTGEGQDHEEVGADLTRSRLNALRYPKDRTDRVTKLVHHHMWAPFTTTRGARRFLNRVGDHADDLMTLRQADQGGKTLYPTDDTLDLNEQRNLVERVRNEQQPTNVGNLAVNGNDLIASGIPPGPIMGQILNQLTEVVLDDPSKNNKSDLLNYALEYAKLQAP